MKQHRQKGYRRFVRVGDSLQQVIAEAIERKVDNPRLGFVTITKVEAAPDLRNATVYVSVLGGGDGADLRSVAALEQSRVVLQREIAKQLRMKWTPRLHFVADDTPARADHITRIIHDFDPTPADRAEPENNPAPDPDVETSNDAAGDTP